MGKHYFQELNEQTATRVWINNPSLQELINALDQGAINCTTNPTYCSGLISKEPEYMTEIIREVIASCKDYDEAAMLVYRKTVKRLMDAMLPLFEESNGAYGYVTMQCDPRIDENVDATLSAARKGKELGPNYMAKIPVINGGIEAIEKCLREGIAVCATEVFTISQARTVCELYEKVRGSMPSCPPLYVTHISGIFDEYIIKTAKRLNKDIDLDMLHHAGVSIAKKEYSLIQDNGYHVTLLGGGARAPHHFTELVGGDIHVTMNWKTYVEIMESGIPVESRVEYRAPENVINTLCEKFPEFAKAYASDGLSVQEYASFGPVQLFRNSFLAGWYRLLNEIASQKHMLAI